MFEIEHYLTEAGHNPFADWYEGLKDRKVKQTIDRRLHRIALGNFGDCKPCGAGVWELRIDLGSGWRVYYARAGQTVILLLCGGSKHTQQADIVKACAYWQRFQQYRSRQGSGDEDTFA